MEEAESLIYVILDLDSFKLFWIVKVWGFIEDKNSIKKAWKLLNMWKKKKNILRRAGGRTLVRKEVSIEWGRLRKQTELRASRNNKVTLLSSKSSSWKYCRQNNTKSECGLQGEIF